MPPALIMTVIGLLYLVGGVLGLGIRMGTWMNKQPVADRTFGKWLSARLGSIVIAACLLISCTILMTDGTLLRWTHLEGSATAVGLAMPMGLGMTWGSHFILAFIGKWMRSKTDTNPVDED